YPVANFSDPPKKKAAAPAGPLGDGTLLNAKARQAYLIALANSMAQFIAPPFGEVADAVHALIEALDAIEGDPDLEPDHDDEDSFDAELCADWQGEAEGVLP